MLTAPFEIGDVYWIPAGPSRSERVTCPMCLGDKFITAIIGSGEKYELECECCMLGYQGPQGTVSQYVRTPEAEEYKIASIEEWRDNQWYLKSTAGRYSNFDMLYKTEEEALAADVKREADLEESNMKNLRKKKYGRVSSWSIQYHKTQIKEFERKIAWHEAKLHAKPKQED
jgi:hypothetical protein